MKVKAQPRIVRSHLPPWKRWRGTGRQAITTDQVVGLVTWGKGQPLHFGGGNVECDCRGEAAALNVQKNGR